MPVGDAPAVDRANCKKMDPKAVVKIGPVYDPELTATEMEALTFQTLACCLTSFTDYELSRETSTEDACIDFDCDATEPAEVCNGPADVTFGAQSEASIVFEVPHYPGVGELAEFVKALQKCCEKRVWCICYPNGSKEIIPCGVVVRYTPQEFTDGGGKAKAEVEVKLCGNVDPFYI